MRARGAVSHRWFAHPVVEAARLSAGRTLPGSIVVDPAGLPLSRVVDEARADPPRTGLAGRTVRQRLPEPPGERPVVDPDATVLEIAAVTASTRGPLVAAVDDSRRIADAITLDVLPDRMSAS